MSQYNGLLAGAFQSLMPANQILDAQNKKTTTDLESGASTPAL